MKFFSSRRWPLPLAGIIAGLTVGAVLRMMVPRESAGGTPVLTQRAAPPARVAMTPAKSLTYEELLAQNDQSLAGRVRMEQAILELTPNESLRRALEVKNTRHYHGTAALDHLFAMRLRWYRAAAEDPARVLKDASEMITSYATRLPLQGIFRAWVEQDPAAAFKAAAATPVYWNGRLEAILDCVEAWAECDPAACAKAMANGPATSELHGKLLAGWAARHPAEAMAWAEKQGPPLTSIAFRAWAEANPVAAFKEGMARAAAGGEPEGPSDEQTLPRNDPVAAAISAFYPLMHRLPETAVDLACRDLSPYLTDSRQHPGGLANDLEENIPGGGERLALSLPPGTARAQAIGFVADELVQRGNFARARELFDLLQTPKELWPAIDSTLTELARHDPAPGHDWLLELKPRLGPDFRFAADQFNRYAKRSGPSMVVDSAEPAGGE